MVVTANNNLSLDTALISLQFSYQARISRTGLNSCWAGQHTTNCTFQLKLLQEYANSTQFQITDKALRS